MKQDTTPSWQIREIQPDYLERVYDITTLLLETEVQDPDLITMNLASAAYVQIGDVLGVRKSNPIIAARHGTWFVLRKNTRLSLSDIGRLAHRDHSTVLNGIRKFEAAYHAYLEENFTPHFSDLQLLPPELEQLHERLSQYSLFQA